MPGAFDDLIPTETQPAESSSPSTSGVFDDLIPGAAPKWSARRRGGLPTMPSPDSGMSGDEVAAHMGWDDPWEKVEKEEAPGVVESFIHGVTAPTGTTAMGLALPLIPDDVLAGELRRGLKEIQRTKPTSKAADVAGFAGGLVGSMFAFGTAAAYGKRGGVAGVSGASSSYQAAMQAGLRALMEGKTEEEAVKIARKAEALGAAAGGAAGAVMPITGAANMKEAAKHAGIMGGAAGAQHFVQNLGERAFGLSTPLSHGVGPAALTMAAIPLAFRGGANLYNRIRGVAPKPKAAEAQQEVPPAPQSELVIENRAKGIGAVDILETTADGKSYVVRPAGEPDAKTSTIPIKELRKVRVLREIEQEKPEVATPKPVEKGPADLEYEAAERAAIDMGAQANKELGLPSEVIEWSATDPNQPFARQIATVDVDGRIKLNRPEFKAWLQGVPSEKRADAVRALFSEEGIHGIANKEATPTELAALWKGLSAPERALVQKTYSGSWRGKPESRPEGWTDAQWGHEYLRRTMQRTLRTPVREVIEGKWTEGLINIVERVVQSLRRMTGRSKPLDDLMERLEFHLFEQKGTGAKGENVPRGTSEPEAFRKGTKAEDDANQRTFDLLPKLSDAADAPIQFGTKAPKAGDIDAAIDSHLSEGRPSFKDFTDDIKTRFPGVQAGQIREAWEDGVWRRLMSAKGSELRTMADRLGFRDSVAKNIPDAAPERAEFALKAQGATPEARAALRAEAAAKGAPSEQRARYAAIAKLGNKLIADASKGEMKTVSTVTPENIGWWRKSEVEPYREITSAERGNPAILARILTDAAAMDRTGKRAPSESVTKRLVALANQSTGAIDVVSVYRNSRGKTMIADPVRTSLGKARPHVPMEELLGRKGTGGKQLYKPVASILLDTPAQGFHQRFATEAQYRSQFGGPAAAEQARRQTYAEGEHIPETVGGDVVVEERPGALELGASRELRDAEVDSVLRYTYGKSRQEIDSAFDSLKERAQSGTLDTSDWQVVNAIQKLVRVTERENPNLKDIDEAISKTFDRVFAASTGKTRAEAIQELLSRKVGVAEGTIRTPRQPAQQSPEPPAGYHESAANARFRQRVAEAAREQARLNEALETADRLNGVPREPSPEAFRKEDIGESIELFNKAVAGMWRRTPTETDIVRWRDAGDNLSNINGDIAGNSVRIASGQGRRADPETTWIRKMAVAIIQSDNSVPRLKEFIEMADIGIAKARAERNKGNIWERRAARQRLKGAEELKKVAQGAILSIDDPALQAAATAGRTRLDQQRKAEVRRGINTPEEENYVPGRYRAELFNDDAVIFGDKILGTRYRAPKTFANYWEAIASGNYVAKNLDLADLVAHRVRQGQSSMQRMMWTEKLKSIVDPETLKPVGADLVASERPGGPGQTPSPYYVEVQLGPGRGSIAVLKPYQKLIKRMTGESGVTQSSAGEKALWYTGLMKHGVQLLFDTFHYFRLLAYNAAHQGRDAGYNRGYAALAVRPADMPAAIRSGFVTAKEAAWGSQRNTIRGQEMTNLEIIQELARGGLNIGRVSDALHKHFYENMPLIGRYNRFLFDRVTRGLMTENAVTGFKQMAEKFQNLPLEEVVRRVVDDINVYYGSIGRQGWIQNPTVRDFTQLLFLAPQWVEGIVKKEARFYGRVLASPVNKLRNKPTLGVLGKGVGMGLAASFALAQIINLITRGKFTFQNEEEGHKWDAWIPDLSIFGGEKTEGFFFSPLSVFGEILHDIHKYMKRPDVHPGDAIQQIGYNKLSIGGRSLAVMFTGRTPDGYRVKDFPDRMRKSAWELAPAPISFGKYIQAAGHAVAPETIRAVPPGQLQKQFFGSAGVKLDQVEKPIQLTNNKALRYVKDAGLDQDRSTIMEFTQAPSYFNVRRAISNQDLPKAKDIIRDLLKTKTPKQIRDAMRENVRANFTGKDEKTEKRFRASLNPKDREIYRKAVQQRIDTNKKFMALLIEVAKERR